MLVLRTFLDAFHFLEQTLPDSWRDTGLCAAALTSLGRTLERIDGSSYEGNKSFNLTKMGDMLFTMALISGGPELRANRQFISECAMWTRFLTACMTFKSRRYAVRFLVPILPPCLLTGSLIPADVTPQCGAPAQMIPLKTDVPITPAPLLAYPTTVSLGAVHAYPELFKEAALLRPPELVNFPFDHAPLAASTGDLSLYGCTGRDQHQAEKTARQEPLIRLVTTDGVTFVRSLLHRYKRWNTPELLPVMLLYVQNCFAGTLYERGYDSFLSHPHVIRQHVRVRIQWLICSLIDYLNKHLSYSSATEQYLNTPKQPGTYLQYLIDIHAAYILPRFSDPSDDDLVKQVVSCFFNSLSMAEKQKLREVTSSYDHCNKSYTFLRSELERTQISFFEFPKMNAAQGNTDALGKRKRPLGPDPEHSKVCGDPTTCEPCKNWVVNVFAFSGFCLRCFTKGHTFYDCNLPIAMKQFRCMNCSRLSCPPFVGNHDRCKDTHKNTKCHCCGNLGHMGSVCQAGEGQRRAYRASSRS